MSCISSNFSSFFLDSLNDPSEFAKYLGNAENKSQTMDEQIFYNGVVVNSNGINNGNSSSSDGEIIPVYSNNDHTMIGIHNIHHNHQINAINNTSYLNNTSQNYENNLNLNTIHYESAIEFPKYLRQSDYTGSETTTTTTTAPPSNHLIDLDNNATNRSNNSIDLDTFDHDSKNIYDIHNSNESNGMSSDNRNISSNTSECSDSSNQASNHGPKPLNKFILKENFDVHTAHKVEEGIFQHMNKLPLKKKETLKQLGVTFTGHMTVTEKSIIVDNFEKFCKEYSVKDHRPFLMLNQSGMAKSEQIKFSRYLGRGLPNFTLFCIYSNFKNIFCTKRFENYGKGEYNLQYILNKTKRFLTCTTADLKNLTPQIYDNSDTQNTNMMDMKPEYTRMIESLTILENFDVNEVHRVEDGIFTHMSRLSPKKQEILKQLGISSTHNATFHERLRIIENFMRFCKEYKITDHRPFLDLNQSGFPKMEQIKFARYIGQGLPNLTLYKIYSAFKDILSLNRTEKLASDGYQLEVILKKKKKNLLNRISAAASKEENGNNVANKQVIIAEKMITE